jgi:hypothetical protein
MARPFIFEYGGVTVKYKVTVPNHNYSGVTEGVAFANGQAVIEDEILANVLKVNYGYTVEEIQEAEKPKAKAKPKK